MNPPPGNWNTYEEWKMAQKRMLRKMARFEKWRLGTLKHVIPIQLIPQWMIGPLVVRDGYSSHSSMGIKWWARILFTIWLVYRKRFPLKAKLVYSISPCLCGAPMAYDLNGQSGSAWHGYWDCSDILRGRAIAGGMPGAKKHSAQLPFAFYELKVAVGYKPKD